MNTNRMLVAVAVAVVAAHAAAAQQPAPRNPAPAAPAHAGMPMQGMGMEHMGMMDSMMTPMMQAMAMSPEHLLAAKQRLGLTSQQESRLTALRDAAKSEHDGAASQAAMHLREMVTAMRAAQPDSIAVRTHFTAAFRAMQLAHWAMLRSATQAWPVLTEPQRRQVTAMADSMMGQRPMMGGMRH